MSKDKKIHNKKKKIVAFSTITGALVIGSSVGISTLLMSKSSTKIVRAEEQTFLDKILEAPTLDDTLGVLDILIVDSEDGRKTKDSLAHYFFNNKKDWNYVLDHTTEDGIEKTFISAISKNRQKSFNTKLENKTWEDAILEKNSATFGISFEKIL